MKWCHKWPIIETVKSRYLFSTPNLSGLRLPQVTSLLRLNARFVQQQIAFLSGLYPPYCFFSEISVMTRYSVETDSANTSKSRGSHLRVHYKHCREITHHVNGMTAAKAMKFMEDVLAFKAVVPFVKYTGGIGRKAQAKQSKAPGNCGRWPVKATAVVKDLLSNAIANAEAKGLDADALYISHAQCNRAPPGRRRTYRAHGRIGKYASQPAHIEFVLTAKAEGVAKNDDGEGEGASGKKMTKKQAAKARFVKVGGDQ